MNRILNFCLMFLLSVIISGCGSSNRTSVAEAGNYYSKTADPARLDLWLGENLDLIVRIQSTVFYQTSHLSPATSFSPSELSGTDIDASAESTTFNNESRAGTAVLMSETNGNHMLLTANHVVSFPDTIWHYRENGNEELEAVSVKVRESFSLFTDDNFGPLQLIASDKRRDLALLTSSFGINEELNPGTIRAGDSSKLNWADFVYAIGFPKGMKVISSGMVSLNERLDEAGFTIDAPFNRGFSGGIVLAVNNQTSEPEWVGMITSTTSDTEFLLTPGMITQNDYTPEVPYSGSVYVEQINRINYGLTHTVSINEIKKFLQENRSILTNYGFGLHGFN